SHIPDGVAFRQAMLAAHVHVGALIGSTMAECDPDFAGDLGAEAIGIFASDRPTGGFEPYALSADARATYDRFAAAWATAAPSAAAGSANPSQAAAASGHGDGGSAYAEGDAEYTISGPAESPSAEATEEALAGFTAAWALFHDVLPTVPRGAVDAAHVAA